MPLDDRPGGTPPPASFAVVAAGGATPFARLGAWLRARWNARLSVWPLLGLALAAGWWLLSRPAGEAAARPVVAADWAAEPVQEETARQPFVHGSWRIVPRADYRISAVVEGTARYRFGALAGLAPLDAVLAWGELPGERYRGRVRYAQAGRFYLWTTADRSLDLGYIADHSANVHLLPSTDNLRRAVLTLDPGDRVRLRGLLVDVQGAGGERMKTSLTRTDSGSGACEVLWVEELQVGDTVYR